MTTNNKRRELAKFINLTLFATHAIEFITGLLVGTIIIMFINQQPLIGVVLAIGGIIMTLINGVVESKNKNYDTRYR